MPMRKVDDLKAGHGMMGSDHQNGVKSSSREMPRMTIYIAAALELIVGLQLNSSP
jgi:hypothetical protein